MLAIHIEHMSLELSIESEHDPIEIAGRAADSVRSLSIYNSYEDKLPSS